MLYNEVIDIASKIPLDEYGKAYLRALEREIPADNEKAVRVQAAYIASNAYPKTEEEKKLLKKLLAISNEGKEVDEETANEIMMERISESFERFTESKVRDLPDEEDIWDLEDSDVLQCDNRENELDMGDGACYVMDNVEFKAFKKLSPEVQQKIRDLAREHIVFDSIGVFLKAPDTRLSTGRGYNYDKDVEEYCHDTKDGIADTVACMVEATVTGKLNGKPYEEWRINTLRNDMKADSWMFEHADVLTAEERDREVRQMKEEREKHKVSLKDFKRFSEEYNYPLDTVLKANPWVPDVLADDAKKAIEKVSNES